MARPLRIEFPGALYHVTSRGNARGNIFSDDEDRQIFLGVLSRTIKKLQWICHAHCLMDNHYHLLVETPGGDLAKGMRQINGIYTQAFNRRHNRVGHLMQGRYKAILVDKESYLLELGRYIVLNPVAAKVVDDPVDWRWSSYRATAGLASRPEFLHPDWVLSHFAADPQEARRRYVEFVMQGIGAPSPWENLKGIFLGSDEFVKGHEPHLSERRDQGEIPRDQRLVHRPELEDLLATEEGKNRAKAAALAHGWGYSLQQISRFWGVHYSTVSRMVKKVDG